MGVWLIDATPHQDQRGVLRRHFCAEEFAAHGLEPVVAQGNISENPHAGTLRGFHYQTVPFEEAKTLSCLSGALYDIVVDLRPNSATFLKWVSVDLSAADRRSLYIPAGCANAWLTTAANTIVHYYMSRPYAAESYRGFRYNDPLFDFRWPVPPRLISDKDRTLPDFDTAFLSGG